MKNNFLIEITLSENSCGKPFEQSIKYNLWQKRGFGKFSAKKFTILRVCIGLKKYKNLEKLHLFLLKTF